MVDTQWLLSEPKSMVGIQTTNYFEVKRRHHQKKKNNQPRDVNIKDYIILSNRILHMVEIETTCSEERRLKVIGPGWGWGWYVSWQGEWVNCSQVTDKGYPQHWMITLDTKGTSLMHTLNLFNLNVYLINKAKNKSTCITVIIKSKKVVLYTSKSLFDRKIKWYKFNSYDINK